ncbi:Transcriptional repressor PaaX [Achromobacter deleyi]|uniref:Transcriptional repressor PaaX n=1 Tax=Achromobacter deleyi TaxID=1353891 RepID=A0A6S6Z4B2_9BURK|nr:MULTISPECIES: phenylacetic acid degradation operon negative regulatory protein PaaX [Achromobacter]CAB3658976.1 Transcriptional repressor PaaX [Achromobacter deleyi]CAB3855016.1 Transcriptional repressor PaaX [Achromobacter deleyi]CAB3894698.1 Transcriptional repressor PaaX [Achromobacter deleyi]CAB3920185.1 Transcriptional repressor PaaX [Achromobacter deleyi]
MANPQSPLDRYLSRLIKNDPPRAKSLCVSLLGDALTLHGGAIWLGDLIELLAPLGINERLLRTSVFRLVAQNWLQSERHGRRSLYLISEHGARHTAHASQRIYEGAPRDWNGEWTLVALPRTGNGLAERAELRRELVWEGFGMIAPGLFAHPHTEARAAHEILEKLGIPDRALVLSARDLAGAGGLPIASLASQCWNLDDVAEQYRQFIKNFGPLEKLLEDAPAPAEAFIARVLLLHSWRRIVLHDPQLPTPMLPDNWPGHAARELCGRIYWRVFDASEAHLDALAGKDNDRYTPLTAEGESRFGGRPPAA